MLGPRTAVRGPLHFHQAIVPLRNVHLIFRSRRLPLRQFPNWILAHSPVKFAPVSFSELPSTRSLSILRGHCHETVSFSRWVSQQSSAKSGAQRAAPAMV